jgi:hypothetical protein
MGSAKDALAAGMMLAMNAVVRRIAAEAAKVFGSVAVTPYR